MSSASVSSCVRYVLQTVRSVFKEKKLSIARIVQTLPKRLVDGWLRERSSAGGTVRRCTGCRNRSGATSSVRRRRDVPSLPRPSTNEIDDGRHIKPAFGRAITNE